MNETEELYGVLVDPATGEIVSQEPVTPTVSESEVNSVLRRMRSMDAELAGLKAAIEYEKASTDATYGIKQRKLARARAWLETQWKPVLRLFAKDRLKGSKTWTGETGKLSFKAYAGHIEPVQHDVALLWNAANGCQEANWHTILFNVGNLPPTFQRAVLELAEAIKEQTDSVVVDAKGVSVDFSPENEARLFAFARAIEVPFGEVAKTKEEIEAIAVGLGFVAVEGVPATPPYIIEPEGDRFYVSTK